MNRKICDYFLYSVAVILILTAAAKLYSATGLARVLDRPDPLLGMTNRQVFIGVGLLELAVSAVLIFGNIRVAIGEAGFDRLAGEQLLSVSTRFVVDWRAKDLQLSGKRG